MRLSSLLAATAVMVAGFAATAAAAPAERHCVSQVGSGVMRCFTTEAAATADIAARNARTASLGVGVQAILIGTDYTDPNYAGSSMRWTAPTGCYYNGGRTSYGATSMPAGWDDVVSSTRTYSGCRATILYDQANYGGLSMVTGCNSPTLSFMDNRASSREWTDQTYGQPC
jgi:hypothetical protein